MKDWNRIFTPSIKAILDGGKRNLPPQPVKFGMPKAPTLPQPVLPQTANTTQQAQTQLVPFTPTLNQTPAPNQTRIPAYKPTQADIIAKGGSITAPRVNPLLNTSLNDAKKLGQGREWMMAQQQSRNEDRQAKLREKLGGLAPFLVGTGRAEQPNQQKGFIGVLESMGSVAREKGVPGLLTEGFNSLLNPTQEDANKRIFEYRDKLIEAGTDPELAIDKAIRNLANQNPNAPILSKFNVPTEDLTPEEQSALRMTNFTEKLFAGLDAPVFFGTTKPVKMGLKTLLKPATYNPEMTDVVKRFSDIVNKTSRATSAEKIEIKGLAQELGDAMVAKGFIAKEATTSGDKTLANTLRQHMDESLAITQDAQRPAKQAEASRARGGVSDIKQPTATARPEAVPTPRLNNQSVSSANLSTEAKKYDSAEAFRKAAENDLSSKGETRSAFERLRVIENATPENSLANIKGGTKEAVLRDNPSLANKIPKEITVYRTGDGTIGEGQFVSIEKSVAEGIQEGRGGNMTSQKVLSKDLQFANSDEFFYVPSEKQGQKLTDLWKQANTPKKPSLLDQLKNPAFRQGGYAGGVPKEFPKPKPAPRIKIDSELKDIRTAIKNKDLNAEKIGQLATRIDIAEEAIPDVSNIRKIVGRNTNDSLQQIQATAMRERELNPLAKDMTLTEAEAVLGKPKLHNAKTLEAARLVRRTNLDSIEGFDNLDDAQRALDTANESKATVKELRDELKPAKAERALANKASKVASTVSAERRAYVRGLQEQFQLSDADIKKVSFGRDLQRMGESEFNGFIRGMENRAMQMQNTKQAKWELNALIEDKHFDKVENYRKAQDLPPVSQMNEAQLRQYAKSLEGFSVGDEFLSPRTLETISRTELGSVKTMREVRVHLWEELKKNPEFKDIKLEDLENMTSTTLDSMRYDTALAESNPFYNLVVNRTQTEMMRGKASFLKIQDETNRLTTAANKSRNTSIFSKAKQSLVPKQKEIVRYLEAEPEAKEAAMKALTKEELDLAVHMEQYYRGALDHLIAIEELRGSRYADAYFTHTKKQFLESWSDDGLINAVRGVFQAQKDAAQVAKIIDQDTGQILSKSKFFKYTLRRTGEGEASNNATKVFLDYVEQMERKKMLDRVIPEIEVYTQALTPKGLTEKGLELDRSLKTFINKYLNNKKGRRENFGGLLEQGGKLDVSLRLGNIIVSIKDLGFSVLSQTAAIVGESVVTYVALGAKGVAKGAKRRVWDAGLKGYIDPNAAKIIKEAEPFIGRNVWTELAEPNISLGEKGLNAMFIGFAQSSVEMNKIFLLSRMTKAELRAGKLSSARLAELRLEAGRWRDLGADVKSIYGATSAGATVNKYKGWAIPIARTTAKNLTTLATRIKSGKLKGIITSREMQETIREVQATALVFYVGSQAMQDNDEDTFAGKWYARIQMEALTIIGAVDPRLFVGEPRLLSFLSRLTDNLAELAMWSKYKTDGKDFKEGDLKGVKFLERQFTPTVFKQFDKPQSKTGDAELDAFIKVNKAEKTEAADAVEQTYLEIKDLPKAQIKARLQEIGASDPEMLDKVIDKLTAPELTTTEKAIKSLDNKARAAYIDKKLRAMPKSERKAYMSNLIEKGVISDATLEELESLTIEN